MNASNSLDERILGLSSTERIRLADLIYSSLDLPDQPELDAAWAKEVEERVAAYDRGELKASEAEEVFARLRGKFER